MRLSKFVLFTTVSPVFLSCGCARDIIFNEAKALEKQDRWITAAKKYELFADCHPGNSKSARALFNAANIYAKKYNLCKVSKPILERLLREYPGFPGRAEAERLIFTCPDYFPLRASDKWIYGDSDTLGENMKQVAVVTSRGEKSAKMEIKYYAGDEFVQKVEKAYRIRLNRVEEESADLRAAVLRYPVEKNRRWSGIQNGQKISFEISSTREKVKVAAGTYSGCLKIKQEIPNVSSSWINIYYAPWTGKVLTSIAGPGFENRVEELLSYERKQ